MLQMQLRKVQIRQDQLSIQQEEQGIGADTKIEQ
jgi:hypothetical protein